MVLLVLVLVPGLERSRSLGSEEEQAKISVERMAFPCGLWTHS